MISGSYRIHTISGAIEGYGDDHIFRKIKEFFFLDNPQNQGLLMVQLIYIGRFLYRGHGFGWSFILLENKGG